MRRSRRDTVGLQFVKLNRQTNPKFQKFAERSIVMAKFADNNFTAVVERNLVGSVGHRLR